MQLKLGLPHYWETVNRLFPERADKLMMSPRKRIKNLVGYPTFTRSDLESEWHKELDDVRQFDNQDLYQNDKFYNTLKDLDLYGLGNNRTADDYNSFAEIDFQTQTCGELTWCSNEELE
jgi:hypothetical protein